MFLSVTKSITYMKKPYLLASFILVAAQTFAQPLTVEKIMQEPKIWIGTSPSSPFWSDDSKTLYFTWNPTAAKGDSLYKITLAGNRTPQKVTPAERRALPPAETGPGNAPTYNRAFTLRLYEKQGDIFLLNTKTSLTRQLTNTVERESQPSFSGDEQRVTFVRGNNLFTMSLSTGEVVQLTNVDLGSKKAEAKPNDQENWLKRDQVSLFEVLRDRKANREEAERITKADQPKRPKPVYTEGRTLTNFTFSPSGQFATFVLVKPAAGAKATIVPSYVTESGFTEDLPARTKVGAPLTAGEFYVYDVQRDTALAISLKDLPGIRDKPDYLMPAAVTSGTTTVAGRSTPASAEKTATDTTKATNRLAKPAFRSVSVSGPVWSDNGRYGVVVVRALDNKDRWIMLLDPITSPTPTLTLLDRQRDEAWIGGPGVGFGTGTLGWLDTQSIYFQSEATGYSHLYSLNVVTGQKTALTQGNFEVQQVQLSRDKKTFYLTTNEVHPGEQHFYHMAVTGGSRTRLTTQTGANDVTLSPDGTQLVNRHSASNQPWELYLLPNTHLATETVRKGKAYARSAQHWPEPIRLTNSQTDSFKAYPWREPMLVTLPARDGQPVYARLYKPVSPNGKAVVFVHGAGYLQNAHKWWSQYFREYMFHNLLADKGYTVLDIDYRGSAGYGRNWRTGIYRFMGGKDLTDQVDAAEWLVKNHGIDPKRIGIYGGSYGGFITLMAMFTTPDVFKAGAALRPVTDWAAYNHGYTANILNEPYTDTLAYRRSSPIYHAAGLKGHLLICHGMVDVNVHFQDAVRLAQRLIELKKENWELAAYPMEDHGFVEPSSWMDEYKRILKLFEERL